MTRADTIRVNRASDHAAFALHGLSFAAILAGVTLAASSPIISGIAVSMTLGVNLGLLPLLKNAFRDALPEEERSELQTAFDRASGRPPEIREKIKNTFEKMKKFSEDLGITEAPSFHYMDDDTPYYARPMKEYPDTRWGRIREGLDEVLHEFLRTEFNKYANAAAFSHKKGRVILTEPLAENLDQDEIDAVTGHEVGHLAARHNLKSTLLGYISSPARITASLFSLVTTFASFKNFGLVLLGGMIGGAMATGYQNMRGLDPEFDDKDKAHMKRIKGIFQNVAVMATGAVFAAPDLVLARALSLGTREGTTLLAKSYSRRNEYQADRLAAEVTRKPMALISGLDKAREHNLHEAGIDMAEEIRKGKGVLGPVFAKVKELYSTHPTNDNRRVQMEKMALSMPAAAP